MGKGVDFANPPGITAAEERLLHFCFPWPLVGHVIGQPAVALAASLDPHLELRPGDRNHRVGPLNAAITVNCLRLGSDQRLHQAELGPVYRSYWRLVGGSSG